MMKNKKTESRGRILFMDDEELVQQATKRLLGFLGYEVQLAGHGDAVLEEYKKARKTGQPFDVVIMDLHIRGGKGGKVTIKKLLDFDSEAKVVVLSGDLDHDVMVEYQNYGFKAAVSKPLELQKLKKILEELVCE